MLMVTLTNNSYYNMKLKITGKGLPKHQQKLQVGFKGATDLNGNPIDFNDPLALFKDWQSRQPGYIDFSKSSLLSGYPNGQSWNNLQGMYKPMGLKGLNGNFIQSTLPAAQNQTNFKRPSWMLTQAQMNAMQQKYGQPAATTTTTTAAPKNKMTGYEAAGLIVGGMGIINNLLAQSEYKKQAEEAKKFSYTDSAYGSYTPSFSRGYQETNRKNPATNYTYPQFTGRTLAPAYGFAQEGGVLMPDEPMGTYEMDVFNQFGTPGFSGIPASEPIENSAPVASRRSKSVNPLATQTWDDISSTFQGVKHLGIWGDKRHQQRTSDHNTGDALDIGIANSDQGNTIAQKLIKEAKDRNVKYIIWNKQIWNPSISNDWRPYTGDNPHTDHVHVSFNRGFDAPQKVDPNAGQISFTHNNPLNIHYGPFAVQYGGAKGSPDGNGNVAIFKDLQTGLKANKDLLFGGNYAPLTISKARNKWVNGNESIPTPSSNDIVKSMGKDIPIVELTPQEKDKLFKLFAKFEGKQAYNLIKDMPIFEEGGEYELDDEQIENILKNGGQIQYL